MPLETGTYISDLNASNPPGSDGLNQADDHIRLIKSTVKASFPNVTGAVTASHTELNNLDGAAYPFAAASLASDSVTTAKIADANVTTPKIADDAVTYAKMQNVSATDKLLGRSTAGAGDVEEITCTAAGRALLDDADAGAQRTTLGISTVGNTGAYSDLTGKPTLGTAAALDVGTTSNKVVQLDGSGKLPAVDGSQVTNLAKLVKLATVDVSSPQAEIDFTSGIDGTYRAYILALDNIVPATNNVNLLLQVSTDAGSSYKTTTYQSVILQFTSAAAGEAGSVSGIPIMNSVANTAGNGLSGLVRLPNLANANVRKMITANVTGLVTGGSINSAQSGGMWDGGNTAINALRVLFSSGNISTGTATLYGIV